MVNSGRLRRAVEARAKAQDRQNIQSEIQRFVPHCQTFVAASAVAFHAVPMMDSHDRRRLKICVQKIRELAEKLRSAAESDAELHTFGRLLTDSRRDTDDAEEILKQAFRKFVGKAFEPLANLGRLVSGIAALEHVGREFSEIAKESGRLVTKLPPNAGALSLLGALISRREKAMNLLSSSNAGADLAAFLSKVADGRATLEDVTPSLRTFLDGQGASRLFRIRFET
jgi:hypothetical protein